MIASKADNVFIILCLFNKFEISTNTKRAQIISQFNL